MLLLLLFVLILLTFLALNLALNVKWTKEEIAAYYGISKQTLLKWIIHCCPKTDLDKWKKVRKLNIIQLLSIISELGYPNSKSCLTKGEITRKCDTYYSTMKENIMINLDKILITEEAYANLDIFPPKVSNKIIKVLG